VVRVKICGITNLDDAMAAVEWGADALGFVFAPSPRQVTLKQASRVVAESPPFICKVGVFVNSNLETVREVMNICNLDLAQLHGSESPDFCQALSPRVIKSFRVKNESVLALLPQYKVSAYLLDSYDPQLVGGTGQVFNWDIAKKAIQYGRIILSGGLSPDNVCQAIAKVHPYAVDVSSGVESSPGKKDHGKLCTFLRLCKELGD
jgi:phosphoribosylanthranilate isomerase